MELASLFLLLLLPPTDATGEMASALEASLHAELGDVAMAMAPDRLVTPAMLEGDNPPDRRFRGCGPVALGARPARPARTYCRRPRFGRWPRFA
jgi:hypothetical protein